MYRNVLTLSESVHAANCGVGVIKAVKQENELRSAISLGTKHADLQPVLKKKRFKKSPISCKFCRHFTKGK